MYKTEQAQLDFNFKPESHSHRNFYTIKKSCLSSSQRLGNNLSEQIIIFKEILRVAVRGQIWAGTICNKDKVVCLKYTRLPAQSHPLLK